jgi:hypothetical protein
MKNITAKDAKIAKGRVHHDVTTQELLNQIRRVCLSCRCDPAFLLDLYFLGALGVLGGSN